MKVSSSKATKELGVVLEVLQPWEVARRQLACKTTWYGSRLVITDRFSPSSRMCSYCQQIKEELWLSERVSQCAVCGFRSDRDLNAALNLAWLAASSADTLNACGDAKRVRPETNRAVLAEAGTEPLPNSCRFA
jgi:putative transposase